MDGDTYGPMVGWGHKPNKWWWGPCRVWTPNVHGFNIAPPYYRGREESACEAHVDQWKQHDYMILSQIQGLNSCVLFCCMYEWLYCKCLCTYVMSCHAIQSLAMYSRCIPINLLYTFIYIYTDICIIDMHRQVSCAHILLAKTWCGHSSPWARLAI